MHVLSPAELAALRVLCKRHERLSRSCGTEPNANTMGALAKLETLSGGFPARVASTGLRRLEIHDDDTRAALAVAVDALSAEIQRIAEIYGVADPGAATPGELMHELADATHSPYGPAVNETRALGLSS